MMRNLTLPLGLLLVCMAGFSNARAQPLAPEPSFEAEAAPQARPRRLFTAVPRIGGHFGVWGGTLNSEIREDDDRLVAANFDASGNPGALVGVEALFRFRSGFRLGAGVLAMPALSFDVEDRGGSRTSTLTAGTEVRLPGIFEWEFAVSEPVSIVLGVMPSILVLARGEQAKNWGRNLCPDSSCKDEGGVGIAVEGEFGLMYWLGTHALRTDVRFGIESLDIASARSGDTVVSQTLVGPRMSLLLGFEI